MKRILAWLLLTALLTAGAGLAENGEGADHLGVMEVVNCQEWVSLRAEPNTWSPRLKKVALGELVDDCVRYDDKFVYCCYDGAYGYIQAVFLSPADGIYADGREPGEDTRTGEVWIEGEPEPQEEVRYESAMGFSLWYPAELFQVNDDMQETEAPGFVLEASTGAFVMIEFLSQEITGMDGEVFLEEAPKQYGLEMTDAEEGETLAGGEWRRVGGYADDRDMLFYQVIDEGREIEIIATYTGEAAEGFYPRIQRIVESMEFEAAT